MAQNPQTGNSPGQRARKDEAVRSGQDGVATPNPDDGDSVKSRVEDGAPEDPTKQPNEAGIVFFEASVSKVIKDDDGNDVTVMSDHVGPGERLLSEVQAEKAEAEAKAETRDDTGGKAKDAAKSQEKDNTNKADAVDPPKDHQQAR